jgi:hypothetical protein
MYGNYSGDWHFLKKAGLCWSFKLDLQPEVPVTFLAE